MLEIARKKNVKYRDRIFFTCTDGEKLNFRDESFDIVTNAFALRNIKNLDKAFLEMKRVLKPGGLFMSLEFARPENIIFKFFYFLYLNYVLPLTGAVLSSNYEAYRYLSRSIQEFMSPGEVCQILRSAGFERIKIQPLNFGIVNIYTGEKK